jgi:acetyl esterase
MKHLGIVLSIFIAMPLSGASYANVSPDIAEFLKTLAAQNGPPIYTLSPDKARKVLDDLQAPTVDLIPANIKDIEVVGSDEQKISVRIVKPKIVNSMLTYFVNPTSIEKKLPVVLYVHGGGWILGNKNTHDYLIRSIANGAKAAVVFVNYTLSPEAQFPVGIEQVYDVAKYIAQEGSGLGLDGSRMIIVGDSVGGNMATAVAQMAKDRGGPHFMHQILLYPVTDANFNTGSYKEFGGGDYWLSKKSMEWFWDAYLPDVKKRAHRYASPLRSTLEQLRGLPEALIIVDENDVLRDEGEAYAHKLMQAGVKVTPLRMLGTIHDFLMLAPLKDNQISKTALDTVNQRLTRVFKRQG